jgi:hypothetical protein
MTESIRRGGQRARHVCLTSVILAISACAHAPAERPVAQVRPSQPQGAVLPDGPSSTYPQAPTPPSAQSPLVVEPSAPAEQPTQVAGLTPEQYSDLFDRMRAGFKLDDHPDEPASTSSSTGSPPIPTTCNAPSAVPTCISTIS